MFNTDWDIIYRESTWFYIPATKVFQEQKVWYFNFRRLMKPFLRVQKHLAKSWDPFITRLSLTFKKVYITILPWIIVIPQFINRLSRIITPLPRLPSSLSFIIHVTSLLSWSGFWSSKTDQWRFKLWRWGYWHCNLTRETNLEHLKSPCLVYLMWSFFDLQNIQDMASSEQYLK